VSPDSSCGKIVDHDEFGARPFTPGVTIVILVTRVNHGPIDSGAHRASAIPVAVIAVLQKASAPGINQRVWKTELAV
jgi:hypothetical protein